MVVNPIDFGCQRFTMVGSKEAFNELASIYFQRQQSRAMKSTFLSRLQGNARYAMIGALVLIIGVPIYQLLILAPSGYGNALTTVAQSLGWIHAHVPLFLGYRALLIVGFALMLGLPFTLFRIIIAQEILGREDDEDEDEVRRIPR